MIPDDRRDEFQERITHHLLKNYGEKLTIGKVKKLEQGHFVSVNYNRIFHIVDKDNKQIYVRNIFFKNIAETKVNKPEELNLSIHEVNEEINNQIIDLQNELYNQIVTNKKLIIKILHESHTSSSMLNRFYALLNDLAISDIIPEQELIERINEKSNYSKYTELICSSNLAKRTTKGLVTTNEFKKILQKKKNISKSVREAMAVVISKHYDYIIYELGLKHIKAYVNVLSSIYYLQHKDLHNISININEFHKIHQNIFGKVSRTELKDRINTLHSSGVIQRSGANISLNIRTEATA